MARRAMLTCAIEGSISSSHHSSSMLTLSRSRIAGRSTASAVSRRFGIADGIHLTVVYTDRQGADGQILRRIIQRTGATAVSAHATKKQSSEPKRPTRGRADLGRLRRMTEADIRRTAPPELADLPADFWDEGELVVPAVKQAISLRVDEDVLDWFKQTGPRYQTRMNAVLRSYRARTDKPAAAPQRKRQRRKSA